MKSVNYTKAGETGETSCFSQIPRFRTAAGEAGETGETSIGFPRSPAHAATTFAGGPS